MDVKSYQWTKKDGWIDDEPSSFNGQPDLGLIFGSKELVESGERIRELRDTYEDLRVVGCTTAGEIHDTTVHDRTLVLTLVEFESTEVAFSSVKLTDGQDSYDAGEKLADRLSFEGLGHVFVLSDGLAVNGSKLVRGLDNNLPEGVKLSGGLAGDADRFEQTYLVANGDVTDEAVGVVGFYGDSLSVGYGSMGGWDPFGPERLITKSEGNVLYELDDKPALDLYKRYLGEHAEDLPASGLLFPLSVRDSDSDDEDSLVRTILSVDEDDRSMTFAGDLPEGHYARLMKANFDRLIDGARRSADNSFETLEESEPELAVLISCVGRKLILKQRTEEEVEAVQNVLGEETDMTGFYSYGEISPFSHDVDETCQLHNQTMTITTFSEE